MHHIEIPPPKLTPRRHDVIQVVNAAIDGFHRPNLFVRQQRAIEAWHKWFNKWQPSADRPRPMLECIKLLSEMMFLGQIADIEFEWDKNLHRPEGKRGQDAYGIATYDPDCHESTYIILDPDGFHSERRLPSRKVALISTLLHECCHAFIEKYGCIEACGATQCNHSTLPVIGATEHASAWFMLAAFAQNFARRHIHPGISLEIFDSILQEHAKSEQMPADDEWARLDRSLSSAGFVDLLSELKHEETWRKSPHILHGLVQKAAEAGKPLAPVDQA